MHQVVLQIGKVCVWQLAETAELLVVVAQTGDEASRQRAEKAAELVKHAIAILTDEE